jgi:hypothetical protein
MKPEINKKYVPMFLKARNLYFIALAMNETNINIDEESKSEIINKYDFVEHGTNKIITSFKQDYLMSEKDFKKYLQLVHKVRLSKGLKLNYNKFKWAINEPWNLCADAETRPILISAKKNLLECGINILPEPLRTEFKQLNILNDSVASEKVLNLILRLDIGKQKNAKEILMKVF